MESKDSNIIDKVSASVENTHRSVYVLPAFRNRIKKKLRIRGNATIIEEKTGVFRLTLRNAASGGKIQRKSLEKLVKWFDGPDANVEDYIKEVI